VESGINDIVVHDTGIEGVVGGAVYIQEAGSQSVATNIRLTNITVNYPSSSPVSDYCMQFV
jgi:hypothetical protein